MLVKWFGSGLAAGAIAALRIVLRMVPTFHVHYGPTTIPTTTCVPLAHKDTIATLKHSHRRASHREHLLLSPSGGTRSRGGGLVLRGLVLRVVGAGLELRPIELGG